MLPIHLSWEPYYRCHEELSIGERVRVSFAGRRYIAVVSAVDLIPDIDTSRIQNIEGVERRLETISTGEIALWKFISSYYLCSPGEVYRLAYPAVRTSGEESQAHSEERREAKEAKQRNVLLVRISRMQERLQKKELALQGRHGSKIAEKLTEQRDSIARQLEEAKQELQMLESGKGRGNDHRHAPLPLPEFKHCPEYDEIKSAFNDGKTVLLSGGPARIDRIIEAAAESIASGKDVLLLVPDLALSKDLQEKLGSVFGQRLRLYHSEATPGERRDTASYLRDKNSEACLVLGTKNAVFLPFSKLGLVIVEEEHDVNYKERDRTPHFNGRDCAIILGTIHNATILLSSPSPSLESILNCINGRYSSISIEPSAVKMELIDTSEEYKKRGMVGSLSRLLIKSIDETLKKQNKVLILRPWGPVDDLKEELRNLWPEESAVGGLDCLTVYEAKRLDLSPYALISIIQAELLIEKSDFRADERAIQTLEQIRGRMEGRMIIQAKQSTHQVFSLGQNLVPRLLSERREFAFPPYTRLLDIVINDNNKSRLEKLSNDLAKLLVDFNPLGPFTPMEGRKSLDERRCIRMSLAKNAVLKDNKERIAAVVDSFGKERNYSTHISLDVDPI